MWMHQCERDNMNNAQSHSSHKHLSLYLAIKFSTLTQSIFAKYECTILMVVT